MYNWKELVNALLIWAVIMGVIILALSFAKSGA